MDKGKKKRKEANDWTPEYDGEEKKYRKDAGMEEVEK